MTKIVTKFLTLERHRRYQVIITIGVFTAASTAILFPEYGHASVIAGVATNLIWIWE